MNIEPLESRIAPAGAINPTTATFIDVDGDQVTIKFSKPIAQQVLYTTTFGAPSITGSEQLTKINLINVTPAAAAGVNITFTAVPTDRNGDGTKDGDGRVNVGEILADGRALGSVTIPGDLARIVVGFGQVGAQLPTAMTSLSVGSMGEYGLATGATDLISTFAGDAGKITVAGNVRDAYVRIGVAGLSNPGKLGSLTVGGSIIGGSSPFSGSVVASNIASVLVRGDIAGGTGVGTGQIQTTSKIGTLTIGGSLLGGFATNSGAILASEIGALTIGRDIAANQVGPAEGNGSITVSKLGSLSIRGSITGGVGKDSGRVQINGDAGSISIGGSIVGGQSSGATDSGRVFATGKIASIALGGSLLGGAGDGSGVIRGDSVEKVSIRGDIRGGSGEISGVLQGIVGLGTVSVGGSIVGASAQEENGAILSSGGLRQLTVTGSILGGTGESSGRVFVSGTLDKATIGGDIRGGTGTVSGVLIAGKLVSLNLGGSLVGGIDLIPSDGLSQGLGSGYIGSVSGTTQLKIGGDVQGGSASSSARISLISASSITIGGSIFGGTGSGSASIFTLGKVAVLTVDGDLRGGWNAPGSGQVTTQGGFGKVNIGGSVLGGANASQSGFIDAGETAIDSLTIGGDLRGGSNFGPTTDSGSLRATKFGSITIGGSIYSGVSNSPRSLIRSGAITSDSSIGALTVRGDLVGNKTLAVVITAAGEASPFPTVAKPEPGIGAITIGGNVDHTFIAAGYTKDLIGISADVQVGAVRVGGDWIASYLTAGAKPGIDGLFGTADDRPLVGGENFGAGEVRDNLADSKIASIVIAGQVKNGDFNTLSNAGQQTYGFVAQQIGSFSYGGIVVPLKVGASNDTFALGKARPLGASRSSLNLDGFAMHVFEV